MQGKEQELPVSTNLEGRGPAEPADSGRTSDRIKVGSMECKKNFYNVALFESILRCLCYPGRRFWHGRIGESFGADN